MPLSFVAGIYGMNFDYMPELRSPLGYLAVWIIFLTIAATMILYFRRRRWL
jgi:magnesium transporter